MPTKSEIRSMEMTHGHAPMVDMNLLNMSQAVLSDLRSHPEKVKLVARSVEGERSTQPMLRTYDLVIRDENLGENAPEQEREALMEFYTNGMGLMMRSILNDFPISPHIDLWQQHDVADKCIRIQSSQKFMPNTSKDDLLLYDPAHVMAKFLADNGVNFPGSGQFLTRTPG